MTVKISGFTVCVTFNKYPSFPDNITLAYVILYLYRTLFIMTVLCTAAGDDYDEIVEVFISANELPNGELTLSVRPFDDDAVELPESFRISGAVSDSDVIPVVFRQ